MEIAARIIDIVFPIVCIVGLGFFCGRRFKPDMRAINSLNMDIFIPALIFSVMVGQSVDVRAYLPLITASILIILGSGLLILPIARLFSIEMKTIGPTVMFNNVGNMGLPLMVLTFGEAVLPIAMILFLVENTLHFTLGTAWLDNTGQNKVLAMLSPLTITTVVAILLGSAGLQLPHILITPIDMLGQIVIPLMLFSLGVRLSTSSLKTLHIGLLGGIAAPVTGIAMVLLIRPFIDLNSMQMGALFLFGALPPAVLNFMFAEKYHQEPDKVASIVIVGHGLTIITLPLVLGYVIAQFT